MSRTITNSFVLGTVQIGLPYGRNSAKSLCSEKDAHEIFDEAWRLGVRAFDTAKAYGCASERLSHWLVSRKQLQEADVVTKVSPEHCHNKSEILGTVKGFEGAKSITVLSHGLLSAEKWSAFQEIVLDLGCFPGQSVYCKDEVLKALDASPYLIQTQSNVLNLESIFVAKKTTVKFDFRSVFLQGLLLDPPQEAEKRVPGSSGLMIKLREICNEWAIKPPVAFLGTALSHMKMGDRVVIGIDSPQEIGVWKEALAVDANLLESFWNQVSRSFTFPISDSIVDPRKWRAS